MTDTSKYTQEELAFYLHQQTLKKAAKLRAEQSPSDIQAEKLLTKRKKRELREARKQEKLAKREIAVKKAEYWNETTPKYRRYIHGAIKRGLSFALSMEEFTTLTTDTECVFCGSLDVGVDRINSKEGYHIHNCQPCCVVCNIMKRNMSDEVFLLHISKIADKRVKCTS